MELRNIVTNTASATVYMFGESLNFKYRPALLTTEAIGRLENMNDAQEIGKFYVELITSWDLTQAGEPVEITAEVFASLPMSLLRDMSKAMMSGEGIKEAGKGSLDG
jgi:hypothetical protein